MLLRRPEQAFTIRAARRSNTPFDPALAPASLFALRRRCVRRLHIGPAGVFPCARICANGHGSVSTMNTSNRHDAPKSLGGFLQAGLRGASRFGLTRPSREGPPEAATAARTAPRTLALLDRQREGHRPRSRAASDALRGIAEPMGYKLPHRHIFQPTPRFCACAKTQVWARFSE